MAPFSTSAAQAGHTPLERYANARLLLYANQASAGLLAHWRCGVGQPLPEPWRAAALQALADQRKEEVEVKVNGQVFAMMLMPIAGEGYLNLYGRDITHSKQAQEEVRRQRRRQADPRRRADPGRDGAVGAQNQLVGDGRAGAPPRSRAASR